MTVEEALPWLKEHGKELRENILSGKYKPTPVRRKEIPKPDGGVRKLGIPTVVDRVVQQAIAQILIPEYCARMAAGCRRGYWFTVKTGAVMRAISNERLVRAGFFELSPAYESIQSACLGRAVYRTVRTVR